MSNDVRHKSLQHFDPTVRAVQTSQWRPGGVWEHTTSGQLLGKRFASITFSTQRNPCCLLDGLKGFKIEKRARQNVSNYSNYYMHWENYCQ